MSPQQTPIKEYKPEGSHTSPANSAMSRHDRVLLTIGNNAYPSCGEECRWPLKGAVNDSHGFRDHCWDEWLVFSAQDLSDADPFYHWAQQASNSIMATTTVVCFQYSGHCRDQDGQAWLIPCSQCCYCTQGKKEEDHANLQTILEHLCKNISRGTKVIVLIDGCRVEEGQQQHDPIRHEGVLRNKQILLVYACRRGAMAREYTNTDGSVNGLFSLALLKCMQSCDTLPTLLDKAKETMRNLDRLVGAQNPSIPQNDFQGYSTTPNFFKADVHAYRRMNLYSIVCEFILCLAVAGMCLQNVAGSIKDDLEALQTSMGSIEMNLADSILNKAKNERQHFENRYEETQKKLEEAKKRISSLTSEKRECENLTTQLKINLESLSESSAEYSKVKKQLDEAETKIIDLTQQIRDTTDERDQLNSSSTFFKQELEKARERLKKASLEHATLQKQNLGQHRSMREMNLTLQILTKNVERLNKQTLDHALCEETKADMQRELDQGQQKLQELQEALNQQKGDVEQYDWSMCKRLSRWCERWMST